MGKGSEEWDDECATRLHDAGLAQHKAAYDLVAMLLAADLTERVGFFKKPGYKGMRGSGFPKAVW